MVFTAFLKSYSFLIKCEAFFTMALAVLKAGYILSLRKLHQLLQAMEHIFFRLRKNIILYSISSFWKCFLKHGNKTPDFANSASVFITFTAVKPIEFASMQILKENKHISINFFGFLTGNNQILAYFFQINIECFFFFFFLKISFVDQIQDRGKIVRNFLWKSLIVISFNPSEKVFHTSLLQMLYLLNCSLLSC